MGVKVRRRNGSWWVFIDYHGKRKAKKIGTREAAEKVKREIEARLALGQFSIGPAITVPTLREYAGQWFSSHVRPHLKPSTVESYEVILDRHLLPRFGDTPIDRITHGSVKAYVGELVSAAKLGRNTVRNILACFRALLNQAVEDGALESNPAQRLGKQTRTARGARNADFLTEGEAASFLEAVKALRPERYPLFLAALRTGMREGELLALRWDDIQFGESEGDRNRFILVRRNFTRGQFTSPKNHKERIDMSKELRRALMELRDQRMLEAFAGGESEVGGLVFASQTGGPLDSRNVYHRDFLPCLEVAGLRRVTFHALRHTFASTLIQHGASLVYAQSQLGHSSIQVTVDVYGHLLPGADIRWIDGLDAETSPRQSATQTQPTSESVEGESVEVVDTIGAGDQTRTGDPRFTKPMLYRLSYAG
jgi:integrase